MPTSIPALVERSLAASTFGSMWLDIPRPDYPQATESIICDLLVVGGGYTGLWTALHAAQRNPDRRIVLIEANRIGWAASGRNGGFVDASLTHGLENGKTRWPNEIDTLEAMGVENLDGMQADIESLGLDAEWQRTGMLSVATEPHQVDWLRRRRRRGRGAAARPARSPRRGSLADLSRGPVQPRHLCDRASGQARVRTGPRLPGSRCAHLRAHQRAAPGLRRRRAARRHAARRPSPAATPCWRRMSFRACCGATGCTPCRCTTTCWPPSRSPTRSSTASAGGAGRESATAPTNFTTTG